jgi:hypothetical protein
MFRAFGPALNRSAARPTPGARPRAGVTGSAGGASALHPGGNKAVEPVRAATTARRAAAFSTGVLVQPHLTDGGPRQVDLRLELGDAGLVHHQAALPLRRGVEEGPEQAQHHGHPEGVVPREGPRLEHRPEGGSAASLSAGAASSPA